MSFFKDFKEDFSQAVNELMPDENAAPVKEEPQMVDTITESEDSAQMADMSELLKQFEEPEPSTQILGEQPVSEPAYEEPVFAQKEVSAPSFSQFEDVGANRIPVPETPVEMVTHQYSAPSFTQPVEPQPQPIYSEPAAPVFAEEEPAKEEPHKSEVEPIFKEALEKSAPINTTENRYMETGVIIEGMVVKGDITSDGNLDIRGTVTGNIDILGKLQVTGEVTGNSKASEVFADSAKISGDINAVGSVKVGQGTIIRGNIVATSGVFAGAVKGDIDINGPVILDSTSVIMGNIKSKSIQINNGAIIEGLCSQCYADVSPMSIFGDAEQEKPAAKAKTKKSE